MGSTVTGSESVTNCFISEPLARSLQSGAGLQTAPWDHGIPCLVMGQGVRPGMQVWELLAAPFPPAGLGRTRILSFRPNELVVPRGTAAQGDWFSQ